MLIVIRIRRFGASRQTDQSFLTFDIVNSHSTLGAAYRKVPPSVLQLSLALGSGFCPSFLGSILVPSSVTRYLVTPPYSLQAMAAILPQRTRLMLSQPASHRRSLVRASSPFSSNLLAGRCGTQPKIHLHDVLTCHSRYGSGQ